MKKTIFFLMAAAGILTACDPSQSEKDFDPVSLAASDVESAVYITQTDANGNPAADGNYFTYTTNPSMMVSIFNLDSEGAENQLARGYSGTFAIKPKRGSDPNQTFYVRTVNSDNSEVIITKQYTVYVQQELDPELRLLASDVYGKKIWKWDTSVTGAVWGNMGYCGGNGIDVGVAHNGQWWGVTNEEEFMGQLNHTNDGNAHGDESMDAYFTLTPDGVITRHAGDGSVINSGSFEIDQTVANDWKVANLNTTAGTILFPYEINSGGNMPTSFEMVYLTGSKMCLVYPDGGDFSTNGSWGEATYWHFKAK